MSKGALKTNCRCCIVLEQEKHVKLLRQKVGTSNMPDETDQRTLLPLKRVEGPVAQRLCRAAARRGAVGASRVGADRRRVSS